MSAPAVERPRSRTFEALRVAAVTPLTDDAAAITFEVPEELRERLAFDAGQSLTVRRVVDGVEHRRSYSICAPVGAAPRIGVREIPGGVVSSWLVREVRPGDEVEVQLAPGGFRATPDVVAAGGRHLCVAAGSGITPVLSIAASLLEHPDARVTLLYGNRTTGSVMFAEEVADLKNAHVDRFQVVHVLSREPRDVELLSGRLDAERLERILTTLAPVGAQHRPDHAWLCGPHAMVQDARDVLGRLGLAPEQVHAELFFVDEPPPELVREVAAPSGATSEATVVLDGLSSTSTVSRDRPLLDSAQETRSDLPFACRGGVCGTCRALVRDGEVEMARNYALEPAEVEAGFVLTCQARPVTDAVTVDFDA
ncbi:putative phenylacetic acid degradation protein PaaE/phenylacetate-CoA oxygenase/reductase, PaaK subunit [Nocardioides sp. OK12]|uniref:Ring-1,2-phenylacetyl-CoA epoxidase subunit PaaE n=1 Tax=Nocardioides marinisabuli TaxID=419476 RepID=A0A7Y9F0M6_9ACTN|nr:MULTISPECIES: 1,2-phenylacetyl-CoA epoxidase subunit PaaE [Nocardioides]NYD57434.1 ring-1,2-phenylacetyl-CoA epoxidase subunit PaaE [Nocardioides marinisabuli]GHJ58545.1 putative phenylacetic acid degradation protein PaaE/phenylacetate-CoA oxygenase/reductase, PaaK subunit [Nocardioides sp. OK12]